MKINEAIKPSTKTLTEQFGTNNDTGFLTEDLVKIYRTHEKDVWHPATLDESIDEIDALLKLDSDE
jgi:hypothetical protein